jgi:hypothetical protein
MVTIIVEGKTDSEFLIDFINQHFPNILREKYSIKIFEGKDKIFQLNYHIYDEIEELVKNDIIEKILICVDADDPKDDCPVRGYRETEQKLNELIEELDFNIGIDYFIFSDEENKSGYLESFLLSILDEEQKNCIKNFRECFRYDLKDKFVFNTFYKQNSYSFDYSHQNFYELKQKLINLFEGIEL